MCAFWKYVSAAAVDMDCIRASLSCLLGPEIFCGMRAIMKFISMSFISTADDIKTRLSNV